MTYDGITYPDHMPQNVVMLPGPHCEANGWKAGELYGVPSTSPEESYRVGGRTVHLFTGDRSMTVPVRPGQYQPL